MNLRRLRGFVLLLLALAWPVGPVLGAPPAGATPSPAPATAATGGAYQVEIVIFRAAAPPAGEDLSASAEGRGFNRQLDTGAAAPTLYRTLEASQMQLGGVASRLR